MRVLDIGAIIRFHRRKSGLSQAELAHLAGLGKTVVYDIEKGKLSVKVTTLLKLCAILNISLTLNSPLMHLYEEQSYAPS